MNILLAFKFLVSSAIAFDSPADYQTGDVIAHTSQSGQSKLIQMGTFSKYSHVGIIIILKGKPYVFEASGRTKYSTVENFIKRGKKEKYTVLRYQGWVNTNTKYQIDLTKKQKQKIKRSARKYKGKRYDSAFKWSDKKMYCSELVWKLYKDAGIKLSQPRKMRSFNLWIPGLKNVMKKRWGGKINLDEPVVSPKDVVKAKNLVVVYDNY